MEDDTRQVAQRRAIDVGWFPKGTGTCSVTRCLTLTEAQEKYHVLRVAIDAGLDNPSMRSQGHGGITLHSRWLKVDEERIDDAETWERVTGR